MICFRDQAANGGSYNSQTPLTLKPAADGLYRASEAPQTPDCPAYR